MAIESSTRHSERLLVGVTIATLLASATLLPLTQDTAYLALSSILVLLLGFVAFIGHRLRLGAAVAVGVQALLILVFLQSISMAIGDPEVAWWARLPDLIFSGIDHMRNESAPMPPSAGVRLILVGIVALMAWFASLLADTLERPAWALLPLLTLYLVPALGLRTDLDMWWFALVAVGYLIILVADGVNVDERWARNLEDDQSTSDRPPGGGALRIGIIIAIPTLVLTLLLGMVLPILAPTAFPVPRPNGSGPIQMADPTIDLRRNLNLPENVQVLSYTTNKPSGAYLRIASLPIASKDGWGLASTTLRQGALSEVPGLDVSAGAPRLTSITITNFRSGYLPLPYAPRAIQAKGQWGYDPASLMVLATGNERAGATEGLTYQVESLDIEPDGARLSAAKAGLPADSQGTTTVPKDIPKEIVDLTATITKGIDSPALKAAAIQAYLRNSPFSYTTAIPAGDGYEVLRRFLFVDKKGYCIQFASAMALMSRIAGIPTRVAVGFLPGVFTDGRWVVTAHDMHAWPELYFEGEGWVRFEPTPAIAVPPPWTVVGTSEPTTAPSPVARPTELPSEEATPTPTPTPTEIPVSQQVIGFAWRQIGIIGSIVAGIVALAFLPMAIRGLRRRIRLRPKGNPHRRVGRAWAEFRDTAKDVGLRWPSGSPRQIALMFEPLLPVAARGNLARLVILVERSRYSRGLDKVPPLAADVTAVTKALRARQGRFARMFSAWLPRSLWSNARSRVRRGTNKLRDRLDAAVQ